MCTFSTFDSFPIKAAHAQVVKKVSCSSAGYRKQTGRAVQSRKQIMHPYTYHNLAPVKQWWNEGTYNVCVCMSMFVYTSVCTFLVCTVFVCWCISKQITSSGSVSLNSQPSPVQEMNCWQDLSVNNSSRNCQSWIGPEPYNLICDFNSIKISKPTASSITAIQNFKICISCECILAW